mgnify:CR=1 FL=1|jgi:hypothetical protein
MIPKSIKGKLFMVLAFMNVTIASFFVALGSRDQVIMSSLTSFLCFVVWIMDLPSNSSKDNEGN